ncbi:unnamed protein product, partial [marine sediment metagenome]
VLKGYNPKKILKKLCKSWGGSPEAWGTWYAKVEKMGCG